MDAVTRYELFKFLHIVGAIAWVGGGIGLVILAQRFVRAKDHAGLLSLGNQGQALGTRLFMPASLVTVGFGIAMVATEPRLAFTDLWILIGFGGILGSGVAQMLVSARNDKRFMELATEHGLDHPDVAAAARKVGYGGVLDVGILLFVVWAMVAKPTL